MKPDIKNQLTQAAIVAMNNAYAPYSNFSVGAALLCADETIITGCNVENLSFGLTQCAEKVAICTAVAQGKKNFTCIAIAADTNEVISPCGACRQVLAEFNPDMLILSVNKNGKSQEFRLAELLPRPTTGILNRKT